ncbi:phage distal tail protein [Ectobacillus ponti]|uniref:Phage tail family protein n=1 Tax=Ectobacillus ponti TaxID=2961894 RepID=A0AA41XEE2_9BACI|nr:phage tail domain-containing protein [Ectobacillus ponti]MCP8970576.1 phage tail family protein [Ectobacillus ponti]
MADVMSWIDADGNETILSNQPNYMVLPGTAGRFMPPVEFIEGEVPFQSGSYLRQVNIKSRDVDIPLRVTGANDAEIWGILRNLLRLFNPVRGNGRLRVTAPDGSQRELTCRYHSGLELSETLENRMETFQKFILVLRAFDPFWYDVATNVQTFTTGQPATFFPFFPIRLSSSTVFADTSVNNTGDVPAWPEWIITGPGDTIFLRNLTTGEVLNLNTSLGAGETLTVDTKPGKKSVRKGDGTNLYYTLSDDSALWSLRQGVNNIRIEMSNATDQSSVQLSYRNRYWGA